MLSKGAKLRNENFKRAKDMSYGKLGIKAETRILKISIIHYIWINGFIIKTMSKVFLGQKPNKKIKES